MQAGAALGGARSMDGGEAVVVFPEGIGLNEREMTMLLCRVHGRRCALPLEHVVETMRPLPIGPLAGAPPGVSGLAVIRGAPVPVVDLSRLFSSDVGYIEVAPTRFVTVRVGQRVVALAVDRVEG